MILRIIPLFFFLLTFDKMEYYLPGMQYGPVAPPRFLLSLGYPAWSEKVGHWLTQPLHPAGGPHYVRGHPIHQALRNCAIHVTVNTVPPVIPLHPQLARGYPHHWLAISSLRPYHVTFHGYQALYKKLLGVLW